MRTSYILEAMPSKEPTTWWGMVLEILRKNREKITGQKFTRYKLAKEAGITQAEYANLLQREGKDGPGLEKIQSLLIAMECSWNDWSWAYFEYLKKGPGFRGELKRTQKKYLDQIEETKKTPEDLADIPAKYREPINAYIDRAVSLKIEEILKGRADPRGLKRKTNQGA